MRASVFAAVVVVISGCRIDIDTPETQKACAVLTVSACTTAAETDPVTGEFVHQDFPWITTNILNKNCTGSACHQKSSTSMDAGRLVFDQGPAMAYKTLVGDGNGSVASAVVNRTINNPDVLLVDRKTNDPKKSYLMFIMKAVPKADFSPTLDDPPSEVGYMPRGNNTLCCQKLDVLERWITAGAPEN